MNLSLDGVIQRAKAMALREGVLIDSQQLLQRYQDKSKLYKQKELHKWKSDQDDVTSNIGLEFEPSLQNENQLITLIMRNHCYLPQIFLSDTQMYEFSCALDDSYIYDRRNVGAIIGMTILGLLGFVALGFTVIGFIAGGALGLIVGRYAGRRLKKQYQITQNLTEWDIYEIRIKCYLKWASSRSIKYKYNINLMRFIIEKLMFEIKPVLHYKQYKQPQQKYAFKLLLRYIDFLKQSQFIDALILSLKLSKEYLRILLLFQSHEVSKKEAEEINLFLPFRSELEVCLLKAVDNVLKPQVSLLKYAKNKQLIQLRQLTEAFLIKPEILNLGQQFPDPQMTLNFIRMLAEKMKQQIKQDNIATYLKHQNFKDIEQIGMKIEQERYRYKDSIFKQFDGPQPIIELPKDMESDDENYNQIPQNQEEEIDPLQQINFQAPYQDEKVQIVIQDKEQEQEQEQDQIVIEQNQELKMNLVQHPNRLFMKQVNQRPGDSDQYQQYNQTPQRSLSKHDVLQILEPEKSLSQLQFHKLEKSSQSLQQIQVPYTIETLNKFQLFLDYYNEPTDTWEEVTKKDQIYIYKAMKPGNGSVFIKGYAIVQNTDKELVFSAVYQKEFRIKWDKIMQGFDIIKQEQENIDVMYYYVSPPVPVVSTREWLQRRVLRRDFPNKGSICLMFYSIYLPELPEQKRRVRAHTEIAGYVFENIPEGTKISFISNNDIRGSIPKILVNHASAKGPFGWFGNLRKACQQYQQFNGNISKINIK